MLVFLSGVLAAVPLLGIAYLWYVDPSLTVGKLFMTLIALTISGLFGLNALMEMKRMVKGESGDSASGSSAGGRHTLAVAAASGSGAVREQGIVESVGYYESGVGRPNHSILTLKAGEGVRLVTLLGDVRDQFPVGRKVELVYRPDAQGFSLVERRIFA